MAVISGGVGRETLVGTNTADTITGGAGNDTFVYNRTGAGHTDVITDFGAYYFSANISGAQEVPSNSSPFTGTASAVLSRGGLSYTFTATQGMDLGGTRTPNVATDNVSAAHFHAQAAGASGGVVFGFFGAPNNELGADTVIDAATGLASGKWDANEGNNTTLGAHLLNAITNRLYINFHSAAFPAGEIRGQMIAQESGYDRIDIRGTGITNWADLQASMSQVGGSTRITTTTGGQTYVLELQGVPLSALTAADFIFDPRGAGYSAAQLDTIYRNIHGGMAPTAAQQAFFQTTANQSAAGAGDAAVLGSILDLADADTAIAVTAYAFFTGLTPSQQGLSYLVSSSLNANDLNDPYYAQFNISNRTINFAENLAISGEAATRFSNAYASLTFSQAVDQMYAEIVGNAQAAAAGINVTGATNDIKGRLAAFQAVAATLPAANQDLATKAAAAGYILGEAIKAGVGAYATASNNFLTDLSDGGAVYSVNLVGTYGAGPTPVIGP